jgi:hypothetical protein
MGGSDWTGFEEGKGRAGVEVPGPVLIPSLQSQHTFFGPMPIVGVGMTEGARRERLREQRRQEKNKKSSWCRLRERNKLCHGFSALCS